MFFFISPRRRLRRYRRRLPSFSLVQNSECQDSECVTKVKGHFIPNPLTNTVIQNLVLFFSLLFFEKCFIR